MSKKIYAPGDITGLAADIADRKKAAAMARREGKKKDAPDARAVYLEACAAIAGAFAPDGFKFAKSGPHVTAKSADKRFTYTVSFQSSRHNIAGEHVQLLAHVGIESPVVKQWATALWKAHGGEEYGNKGFIAGTQLGYLAPEPERDWIHWELAGGKNREAAIAEVTDRIRRHVLPWFAHCEDIPALVEKIEKTGSYPQLDTFPSNFLLCFASREQTERALRSYLAGLPRPAQGNLYKEVAKARAESPLRINYSGFYGCDVRTLLAEGIEFPPLADFT